MRTAESASPTAADSLAATLSPTSTSSLRSSSAANANANASLGENKKSRQRAHKSYAGSTSVRISGSEGSPTSSRSAHSAGRSPSRQKSTPKSPPSDEGSGLEHTTPRVVYGPGTVARLPTELGRLCVSSPLIVSSPSRIALARRIQTLIPNLESKILDSAVVNVPIRVVDDAVARIEGRDVVISVGGASAVGLAKAIGCRKGIPHICIPTTYSGSEMMPLLLDAYPARHEDVLDDAPRVDHHQRSAASSHRDKKSPGTTALRDPKGVMPSVIIYDEELTMSTPRRISAPTGAAATARSIEFQNDRSSKNDDTAQWSYLHLPGV